MGKKKKSKKLPQIFSKEIINSPAFGSLVAVKVAKSGRTELESNQPESFEIRDPDWK